MDKNKIDSACEIKTDAHFQKDEILQKADRLLSVIKNINREGGITTQLMMAAACIELQNYDWYLQDTYCEKEIERNDFPSFLKLEEYIRLFKDIGQDFWNDLYGGHHNTKQREEDIEIIYSLKEVIIDHENLCQYEENDLDSLIDIKTDINMLSGIFSYLLRIIVSEFESIYQELRKKEMKTTANTTSQKKKGLRNYFREYIKDKEHTEEILKKLHRFIGNRKNTEAINKINEAMWIEVIEIPTAPSLKDEFDNITCRESYINRILDSQKPLKNGKIDEERLNKIRQEFKQA